jgi:hypothetical protein
LAIPRDLHTISDRDPDDSPGHELNLDLLHLVVQGIQLVLNAVELRTNPPEGP